jgi:hypothetical protein
MIFSPLYSFIAFFRSQTTINNCDELFDWYVSLITYIYTRLCLFDGLLDTLAEVAAPAAIAGGTIAAASLFAMPPLPMTLASGIPPGKKCSAFN